MRKDERRIQELIRHPGRAGAPGCDSGFLHPRPPSFEFAIDATHNGTPGRITFSACTFQPMRPQQNSPLAKRAWVFQERLLSARILYFGSERLYFECFAHQRYGECSYPCRRTRFLADYDTVIKQRICDFKSEEEQ